MITPAPGIILVTPQEDEGLKLTTTNPTRVLKGKVVAVGDNLLTDFGAIIKSPVKKGQTVYYLSYEGNYDFIKDGADTLYMVKVQDIRAYEK